MHTGERTSPEGKAVANSLLLAIPDDEFHVIRPHLQFVCLPQRTSLHGANTKLEDAYFLNTGMVSLVFTTRDRESVEVGVVGNEGFTPIPIAAGFRRSPHRAVMQIGGRRIQGQCGCAGDAAAGESESAGVAAPVCGGAWIAGGADGGLQSPARSGAAACVGGCC